MKVLEVFDKYVNRYEAWFLKHPAVFTSEVEAIRLALPEGNIQGIEVGLATGKFSEKLKIAEGVEPSYQTRQKAIQRGIHVFDAIAHRLPFKDMRYDFVLMVNCIIYFDQMLPAFLEAKRILKKNGSLIVSFIDKDSVIGKKYEAEKNNNVFYKHAQFYSVSQVKSTIEKAGFSNLSISQTLFGQLNEIKSFQPSIPGHGKGSFVVIQALRNS